MATDSQPHYGGYYFPYVQPPNIPTTQTHSENASSSTSTNPTNEYDSDHVAPNLASSDDIGAKGNTSTRWKEEQTTVLVHEWRERIE